MRRPSGAALGVVGVAVAYVAAQLLLFDPARGLGWDEAIYVAEVTPDLEPIFFDAQRARGITHLIAPAVALGADVDALRVYLAGVSGFGLAVGFLPWVPTVRAAAPAGALLFAFSWASLLYGSEVYPNLFAAFAAVAAAGWLVRSLERPTWPALALVALCVALVALLRPTEGVWLALGLGLGVLAYRRPFAWRQIAAVGVGGVLGWLPWLLEARARWGSIGERFRVAQDRASLPDGVEVDPLRQYLAMGDGPTSGPIDDPVVSAAVVVLVLVLAVAAAAGVARPPEDFRQRPARAALLTAVALLAPYFLITDHVYPRFLLPAYALVCVPVAVGFLVALQRADGRVRPSAAVGIGAAIVLWAGWQAAVATANEEDLRDGRETAQEVGAVLGAVAGSDPCAFASQFAYPQIQVASGCTGTRLALENPDNLFTGTDPDALADEGFRFFAVLTEEPPEDTPLAAWPRVPVAADVGDWRLYEHPGTAR